MQNSVTDLFPADTFNFIIFPNPASDIFTIKLNKELRNATLEIYNAIGIKIKTLNFTGRQLVIGKEEMQKGIYFIRITDKEINVINKKIIIQ